MVLLPAASEPNLVSENVDNCDWKVPTRLVRLGVLYLPR